MTHPAVTLEPCPLIGVIGPSGWARELFSSCLRATDPGLRVIEVDGVENLLSEHRSVDFSLFIFVSPVCNRVSELQECVRELWNVFSGVPLALTFPAGYERLFDTLPDEITGLLCGSLRPEALLHAVQILIAGGTLVPPSLMSRTPSPRHQVGSGEPNLSSREHEVLRLVREGKTNKSIAGELGLAENTVKVHVRNIMKKLHARKRKEV